MYVRSSGNFTRRRLVIPYKRFGATYRSCLQRSSTAKILFVPKCRYGITITRCAITLKSAVLINADILCKTAKNLFAKSVHPRYDKKCSKKVFKNTSPPVVLAHSIQFENSSYKIMVFFIVCWFWHEAAASFVSIVMAVLKSCSHSALCSYISLRSALHIENTSDSSCSIDICRCIITWHYM